ncbi:hypothetical protein X777_15896 [Ooceraea biroi]|uniref:Uncharacterized protein n=1 Tax=Ooceraea biroi TaxID=2015173 RepID=A0A026WTH2_OOCBI|nr:hypothetical protein X777_15896 [Ooceraea biroi]
MHTKLNKRVKDVIKGLSGCLLTASVSRRKIFLSSIIYVNFGRFDSIQCKIARYGNDD